MDILKFCDEMLGIKLLPYQKAILKTMISDKCPKFLMPNGRTSVELRAAMYLRWVLTHAIDDDETKNL